MGAIPKDKIARWVAAAGQTGKSDAVTARVISAAQFLEHTGRMSEAQASGCLTGIDFSKDVTVVRLPDSVYVQYVEHHKGIWFTDTGLRADTVGLSDRGRDRRLYRPQGMVWALKSTARPIKDVWTTARLQQSLAPLSGKTGQFTLGGGAQYVVPDKFAMKEI